VPAVTRLAGCTAPAAAAAAAAAASRSTTHLQQAFINQQLRNFTLTTLPDAQQAVDKAFCSVSALNSACLCCSDR
jgi:hypothetical protein